MNFEYLQNELKLFNDNFNRYSFAEKKKEWREILNQLGYHSRMLTLELERIENWLNLKQSITDELEKHKSYNPMVRTGEKAYKWCESRLEEQRLAHMIETANIIKPKEGAMKKLTEKHEFFIHILNGPVKELFEKMQKALQQEQIRQAAKTIREMKQRGIDISSVKIPNLGRVKVK